MKTATNSAPLTVAQSCEPVVLDAGLYVVRGMPKGAYSTIIALHDYGQVFGTFECASAAAERRKLRTLPDEMALVEPGAF